MRNLVDPLEVALSVQEQGEIEVSGLNSHDLCPVCSGPMIEVSSLGNPARFCPKHNVAMPNLVGTTEGIM